MKKMLVIGLDGATFDLIRPWAEQGKLPNMTRLLAEGASGDLRSVPNMNSAPAWASFATGMNPGKHGIFYFDELIPGTYNKRYLNGAFRHGEALWTILSRMGKRVGIINVPMTYPAEEMNGFAIAGLDTPGIDSPGFTHPPSLAVKLASKVGDYIIEPGIPGYIKAGRRDVAVQRIFEAIEKRLAYTLYLIKRYPCDLLVVVFTATDAAQHFFWKDMDLSHPEHDPAEAQVYGDTILRVYQRMDEVVGELTSTFPDATVMLMSDHGGGFNQRGAEYLNDWLEELGLLTRLNDHPSVTLKGLLTRVVEVVYRQVDKRLSREAKLRLAKLLPGVRERMEMAIAFRGIDWSATKAYAFGARDDIWINLVGREPQGVVQPGREYEELCDFIIAKLRQTKDIKTSEPVVDLVARREEVYHGERMYKAPDILIRWRTDFVIHGLYIPDEGKNPAPVPPLKPNPINGGHRMNGIFIMAGEGVKKGAGLRDAQIIDLAPTILYLFGLPVTEDMDGRVLSEAFEEAYLRAHPIVYRAVGARARAQEAEYSAEEARLIKERLRGLGYVE